MEAGRPGCLGEQRCVLRRCGSEASGRQVRERASGAIGGVVSVQLLTSAYRRRRVRPVVNIRPSEASRVRPVANIRLVPSTPSVERGEGRGMMPNGTRPLEEQAG